jgi:hypothetical protein
MTTIKKPPDERYLTAHHEAGHAVVALMRGGELTSISIDCSDPCTTAGHPTTKHAGYTGFRAEPWDIQFATYAGPWAEARCQWNQDSLHGEDDDGRVFGLYVIGAWRVNRDGDYDKYVLLEEGILPDGTRFDMPTTLIAEREEAWDFQLEKLCWPVIRTVARLLMQGCTDVAAITAVCNGA